MTDRLAFPESRWTGSACRTFVRVGAADAGHVAAGRALLPEVTVPDAVLEALCGGGRRAGRGVVAGAAAGGSGGAGLGGPGGPARRRCEEDAMVAARLVLAPRATVLPMPPPDAEAPPEQPPDAAPDGEDDAPGEQQLGEILLQAARAAMPAGLLAQLAAGRPVKARAPAAGRAGALQAARRGRPIGERWARRVAGWCAAEPGGDAAGRRTLAAVASRGRRGGAARAGAAG